MLWFRRATISTKGRRANKIIFVFYFFWNILYLLSIELSVNSFTEFKVIRFVRIIWEDSFCLFLILRCLILIIVAQFRVQTCIMLHTRALLLWLLGRIKLTLFIWILHANGTYWFRNIAIHIIIMFSFKRNRKYLIWNTQERLVKWRFELSLNHLWKLIEDSLLNSWFYSNYETVN